MDGPYLGGNQAWLELIGQSGKNVLGKTDFDLFPEDVATGFREKDKEMLSQLRTQRNDEWVTYPDGLRVLLETVKTPLYDGDGAQCPMTGFTSPVRIFGWMVGRCRDRCVSVGSAPTAARSLILLQHCLEFSHAYWTQLAMSYMVMM